MAKNLVLWLVIAAVLLMVFQNFSPEPQQQQLNYSQFIEMVRSGQVEEVTIEGQTITGTRQNGNNFTTIRPAVEDPNLMDDLYNNNVEVIGKESSGQSIWTQLLVASFPILIIIAIFIFFMRQMRVAPEAARGPCRLARARPA